MKSGLCDIDTAKLHYRLYGEQSNPLVIVETALGSCSAEWWHLAEKWSSEYCVLLYERAGYGSSSSSSLPRSPLNIASELNALLTALNIRNPAILIGHSMGGLYAQQFIRMFPEKSCGLVLLDPVSPENYVLKQRLTKQEYFQCGFDKIANMKMGFVLTSLGLGFLFKPLLRKAPPFYYYPDFSKDAEDAILRNATQRKMYRSSMAEYAFIDSEKAAREGQVKFPDLPLVLICHSPEVMISEIMKYGGADQATAAKCDDIWVSLMKGYLEFSNQSNYRQAENSGHFIHLSDPDGVWRALKSIQ